MNNIFLLINVQATTKRRFEKLLLMCSVDLNIVNLQNEAKNFKFVTSAHIGQPISYKKRYF